MLQIVAGPVVGELGLGLAGGRAGQRWGTLAGGWALVGTQPQPPVSARTLGHPHIIVSTI